MTNTFGCIRFLDLVRVVGLVVVAG
jgi:hypothetical protein